MDFLVKKHAAGFENNVGSEPPELNLLKYVTDKIPCSGKLKLDHVGAQHCVSEYVEFAAIFETYPQYQQVFEDATQTLVELQACYMNSKNAASPRFK